MPPGLLVAFVCNIVPFLCGTYALFKKIFKFLGVYHKNTLRIEKNKL